MSKSPQQNGMLPEINLLNCEIEPFVENQIMLDLIYIIMGTIFDP
jgi:hypothetical protein